MIKENQRVFNALNVISDAAVVFLSIIPAYLIRFYIFHGEPSHMVLSYYLVSALWLTPVFMFVYAVIGLFESYRSCSFHRELERIISADLAVIVAFTVYLYVVKDIHVSRLVILFYYFTCTALVGLKRLCLRHILRSYRAQGYNLKHILVIGSGAAAEKYRLAVEDDPSLGYNILGCITDDKAPEGLKTLGTFAELQRVLDENNFDEAVAALSPTETHYITNVISACEKSGTKLSLIPYYFEYMPSHPYVDEVGGIPLINIRRIPLDNLANAFVKRSFDIVAGCLLILIFSPVMLIAAAGVMLSSPGPVIFKQTRVGLGKKNFTMYKFRSMRVNAAENTGWTTDTDPRKTKFGSFIRKFSIDELPQLFNVVKGDMSLVGPRPELPVFVEQFKESVPLYMVKHQVRPGMTGWAQVCGFRGDTSIPERIKRDIYYIENWSWLLDIKILILTLFKGFVNTEKLK